MVFYIFSTTKITRFIEVVGTNVIYMKSIMNKREQNLNHFHNEKLRFKEVGQTKVFTLFSQRKNVMYKKSAIKSVIHHFYNDKKDK